MKKITMTLTDDTGKIVSELVKKDFPDIDDIIVLRDCFINLLVKADFEDDKIFSIVKVNQGDA